MSIREEIQITDLEPSIEGGEDVEYIVQIRGIDATGRPGPWSEELKFTSPQQIPSLQSFNYVPGEGGWRLDNDGSFEVNDGTIRGTLESFNYVPGVSGWQLDPDGFAEFDTGIFRGALRIGQNTFNVDTNGNLYIGGTTPQNAPFSVDTNGQILAMDIDAGLITAGTIGANVVYAGTIVASQIVSGTINGARIPDLDASKITDGQFDPVRIPNLSTSKITSGTFDPVRIPNLDADKITAGTLNADNVTISGTLSAVTLSGVGGTFSGNLTSNITTANAIQTQVVVSSSFENRSGETLFIRATNGGSNNIIFNGSNYIFVGALRASSVRVVSPLGTSTGSFVRFSDNGTLREDTSSKRFKKKIKKAKKIDGILDLSPVTFIDKSDPYERIAYGLIAEDLDEKGMGIILSYDEDKITPRSIDYSKISVALIPYVKELYDRIEELERKIDGN